MFPARRVIPEACHTLGEWLSSLWFIYSMAARSALCLIKFKVGSLSMIAGETKTFGLKSNYCARERHKYGYVLIKTAVRLQSRDGISAFSILFQLFAQFIHQRIPGCIRLLQPNLFVMLHLCTQIKCIIIVIIIIALFGVIVFI